jgi:hypothetical protein
MSDYDVGYGRPPRHSQFKMGVCPNPRGRGKRGDLQIGEIMKRVLNATTEFRDHGKVKKASRLELSVRRLCRIGGQRRHWQRQTATFGQSGGMASVGGHLYKELLYIGGGQLATRPLTASHGQFFCRN